MNKQFSTFLFLIMSAMVAHTDNSYPELLEALESYQTGYSDTNALQVIYNVARSEDHEEVVTRCMGIYTLHMGSVGNASLCQGGFLAIRNRYPDATVIQYLQRLDLFPEPCPTCNGTGSVQIEKNTVCETCKNTGRCTKCVGYGEYKFCTYCRQIWTYPQLKRLPYPVGDPQRYYKWCYNCYPREETTKRRYASKTQPTLLQVKKCTDCSGTGKCPQCRGMQGATTAFKKCPTCLGVSKGVRTTAARQGLIELCRDTTTIMRHTIGIEKAYEAAMSIEDAAERLSALKACLETYPASISREQVSLAIEEQKTAIDALKRQEEQNARELALAKEQEVQRQNEMLQSIRRTQSKRAALAELRQFLSDNPDTPSLVEARLLLAELEDAVAAEEQRSKRNRWILIGVGSLIVAAILASILNAVTFTRKVEVMIPITQKREVVQRKIPLKRNLPAQMTEPRAELEPKILSPVTIDTPQENIVACAECGALIDCPPDVHEEDVICGVCQKAFHVH